MRLAVLASKLACSLKAIVIGTQVMQIMQLRYLYFMYSHCTRSRSRGKMVVYTVYHFLSLLASRYIKISIVR